MMLAMQTKGKPRRIVRSAEEGNGFASWRLLQQEYEMQGPGKELLMLRKIVAYDFKGGDMTDKILIFEELVKHHDCRFLSQFEGSELFRDGLRPLEDEPPIVLIVPVEIARAP